MSALNLLIEDSRVHLITDGLGILDGRGYMLQPKTFQLPHLNMAVGIRGTIAMKQKFQWSLATCRTVEEFKSVVPGVLRSAFEHRTVSPTSRYHFDLVAAGVENGKAFAYLISSAQRPWHDAYEMFPLTAALMMPDVPTEKIKGLLAQPSLNDAARGILNEQLKSKEVSIGGFGQITTVDAEGITTRVLKGWPAS